MKKKVLALFTALLMVFSLAGCNTEGLSLLKELEKANTWEAIEQSGTIDMAMKAGGEEVKFTGTYEAFSNVKDVQMEMTVTPKAVEVSGIKVDLTQGEYKFSPVKMYMDGLKIYISTSYIKDICRLAGTDASVILEGNEEYVAINLADDAQTIGVDLQNLVNSNQSDLDIYKNLKVEVPVKQEGRKYAVTLTGEQMVDALFEMVNTAFESQSVTIKETYKAMGLSDEEIEMILAQVKAVYNDDTKAQVKPFVKDSTGEVSFEFTDDKYVANYNMDLKVNLLGEEIAINITLKDEVKKVSKKAITFPTSVKTYTMEELMGLEMGSNTIQVLKTEVISQNGKDYVPAKSTLASVGISDITFNKADMTITINELGMDLPVIVKNGTSYVAVETLEALGLSVEVVG